MKKTNLLLIALVASALVGCNNGPTINAVIIRDESLPSYIVPGESLTFQVQAGILKGEGEKEEFTADSKAKVTWSVSPVGEVGEETTLAVINPTTGLLEAKGEGSVQVNAFLEGNNAIVDSETILIKDYYTEGTNEIIKEMLDEELPYYKGLEVFEDTSTYSSGFISLFYFAENDTQIADIDEMLHEYFGTSGYVYTGQRAMSVEATGKPTTDVIYQYDKAVENADKSINSYSIVTGPLRTIDAFVPYFLTDVAYYPAYFIQLSSEVIPAPVDDDTPPEQVTDYLDAEKAEMNRVLGFEVPFYNEYYSMYSDADYCGGLTGRYEECINLFVNIIDDNEADGKDLHAIATESDTLFLAKIEEMGFELTGEVGDETITGVYVDDSSPEYILSIDFIFTTMDLTIIDFGLLKDIYFFPTISLKVLDEAPVVNKALSADQLEVITDALGASFADNIVMHDLLADSTVATALEDTYKSKTALDAITFTVADTVVGTTQFNKEYATLVDKTGLYDLVSSSVEGITYEFVSKDSMIVDGAEYKLNIKITKPEIRKSVVTYYLTNVSSELNEVVVEGLYSELINRKALEFNLKSDSSLSIAPVLNSIFGANAKYSAEIIGETLVAEVNEVDPSINAPGYITGILGTGAEEVLFDHDGDEVEDEENEEEPTIPTAQVVESVVFNTAVDLTATRAGHAVIEMVFELVYDGNNVTSVNIVVNAEIVIDEALLGVYIENSLGEYPFVDYAVDSYIYSVENDGESDIVTIDYITANYENSYVQALIASEVGLAESCYLISEEVVDNLVTTTHHIIVGISGDFYQSLVISQSHDTSVGVGTIEIFIADIFARTFAVAYSHVVNALNSNYEIPDPGAAYYGFDVGVDMFFGTFYYGDIYALGYATEVEAEAALVAYGEALVASGYVYDDVNDVYSKEVGASEKIPVVITLTAMEGGFSIYLEIAE